MKIENLPIELLMEAPWNTNQADEAMMTRLRNSINNYGLIQNLVVRPLGNGYEVLGGDKRLKLLLEMGIKLVPCVVMNLDDIQARLLSQILNHVHGEDDLGLRAELMRQVLQEIPEDEVLGFLPDTLDSLKKLASLGTDTITSQLQHFEIARAVRLRNLQFKITTEQLETVEAAIDQALPKTKHTQGDSPNIRGTALYLICRSFLEKEKQNGSHLSEDSLKKRYINFLPGLPLSAFIKSGHG
jgi:ParB family transcriptional regulator, chromosome partitioning protein